MSMTDGPTYVGSTVVDEQGNTIGRVRDVIFDGAATQPTWLVVKPGLLKAEHYVPTRGAYRSPDNDLVVPYHREHVASSPKARRDHIINHHERALLAQHFELTR
jgi:sporulation protein YlmC with PRC-barrel domain